MESFRNLKEVQKSALEACLRVQHCQGGRGLLPEALMALAKGWPKEGAQRIKALRGVPVTCASCLCRVGDEAVGCFKERKCLGEIGMKGSCGCELAKHLPELTQPMRKYNIEHPTPWTRPPWLPRAQIDSFFEFQDILAAMSNHSQDLSLLAGISSDCGRPVAAFSSKVSACGVIRQLAVNGILIEVWMAFASNCCVSIARCKEARPVLERYIRQFQEEASRTVQYQFS